MKKLMFVLLAGCLMLVQLATGCSPQPSTAVNPPVDTVVSQPTTAPTVSVPTATSRAIKNNLDVILKGEPSNLDPHNNGELVAFTIQMQIFDNLVKKDASGKILPSVATRWEQIDAKTVRFYLRNDVYFSNGEKLTAEDVRFSIQRATTMPFSSSIFSAFDGTATKVVDDTTIDVVTKAPFAGVFNYLASTRGAILSKSAVQSLGDTGFGRNPVGSGPFIFDSWVTGTDIKVVRNEKYWGVKPAFSSITFKFITEAATRSMEVESGNADIGFDVSPSDVPRLQSNNNLNVVSCNSFGYSYIIFNDQDPIMSNILVRQALSLAVDKPSMVKAVYGDFGTPADSVMPATVFAYQSQGPSEYNVEKAKQLLTQAGYANGLTVTIAAADTQEAKDIAEIAQSMWSQIGVTANIKVLAVSEWIAAGRRGENQIGIIAATFSTGDPGHALADFDTRVNSDFHSNDTKIDTFLDQGMQTYDPTARAKIYQDAQKYITAQYYMIPVAFKMVIYVTTKNVENFVCNAGNATYLGDVIPYVK
jgi:peptide/nickel transport system substrate-binding protein